MMRRTFSDLLINMKHRLSAGLLLLSVLLFPVFVFHRTDRFAYSGLVLSEKDFELLTESRKETDRELLKKLTFNGSALFFDELTDSWFYSVSADAPAADPTVGFSSADRDVRVAFDGSAEPGRTVQMAAYTGTEYKEYRLAITTLPLIRVECEEETCGDEYSRDIFPIRFTLIDNRPGALMSRVVSDGTIHTRGWSSRNYPKRGFRLSLYEKGVGKERHENRTALLGLRNDGDWLLYAAYNDQERIRNVFSSNLWMESCGADNDFGLKNGMEYRYAELFFGNRYWGLYALGYPIDTLQTGIEPDGQGYYDEYLFKQKEWGPRFEDYGPEPYGLDPQFDGSESEIRNGLEFIKNYYERMLDGAPGGLWHNDEKNIVDIWLFTILTQAGDTVNSDRIMKNLIYTVKSAPEGRKLLFTPWDLDMTWGNYLKTDGVNFTKPYGIRAGSNRFEMLLNPVSVLRQQDPEIKERIRARYHELRSGAWSEQTLDAMLDGFEQDIFGSGAYVRDTERWPESSRQDPAAGLSLFRGFVHERLAAMDAFIDGPDL